MTSNQQAARELLPCPFCGGEPEMIRFTDEDGDPCAAVQCKQCGAGSCKYVALMDDARPSAAAAWNRRPTPPDSGDGNT